MPRKRCPKGTHNINGQCLKSSKKWHESTFKYYADLMEKSTSTNQLGHIMGMVGGECNDKMLGQKDWSKLYDIYERRRKVAFDREFARDYPNPRY